MLTKKSVFHALMLGLITFSLSGCGLAIRGMQGIGGVVKDSCGGHPVLAEVRSGCPKQPNFGITRSNANDMVNNTQCVLEFAVGKGSFEMFTTALNAGADPERCEFQAGDDFYLSWLTGQNCNDARFPRKFEELGIKPTVSPDQMFANGYLSCPVAIEYALNKGADPNAPIESRTPPWRALETLVSAGGLRQIPSIKKLIQLGADPFLPTGQTGEPIFEYAKRIWTGPKVFGEGLKVWPEMEKALLGQ